MKYSASIAIGICALVVAAVLFLLPGDSTEPLPKAVRVMVESGEVLVRQGGDVKTLRASEELTALPGGTLTALATAPAPLASVTTPSEETPAPTAASGALSVRVVDALGDLIQDATLEIAGTVYNATGGRVAIEDLADGAHTVRAHAEGYTSAAKTIETPAREGVEIVLEYTCSFVVAVHDKKEGGRPVAGAEVQIWEGPSVQRPVRERLLVTRKSDKWDRWYDALELRRQDNHIRVGATHGIERHYFETYPGEKLIPRPGDAVTGLTGGLMPGQIPSLLRLWDSIALLCPSGDDSHSSLILECQRGGVPFNCSFYGAGKAIGGKPLASGITDADGQCRFADLPPRLYFASARTGGSHSYIHRVCPAFSNVRIPLFSQTENALRVKVLKEGIEFFREKFIEGVDVELKGLNEKVAMSAVTNGIGDASLWGFPLGEYEVTVTPPGAVEAVSTSKTLRVSIVEPYTELLVPFELGNAFSVSGTVLCVDTEQPVEGFTVELSLNIDCRNARRRRDKWMPYALARSDAEGRFEFAPVEPGEFKLQGFYEYERFNGYVSPAYWRQILGIPTAELEPRFTVESEDVNALKFYVLPGDQARFLGEVVTAEGSPVHSANLTLNTKGSGTKGHTLPGGTFELAVFMPESDEQYEAHIEARCYDSELEPQTVEANGRTWHGDIRGGGPLERFGSVVVPFRLGKTVHDIRIVLEPEKGGPIVTGTIRTRDGGVPDFVQFFDFSARQRLEKRRGSRATIHPDGSYTIDLVNFAPGPFRIDLFCWMPELGKEGRNSVNPLAAARYLDLFDKDMELPEDADVLKLDIVLEDASYFHGQVLDSDLKPVPNALVRAYESAASSYGAARGNTGEAGYRSVGKTNQEGIFLVDGVLPGLECVLEVFRESRGGKLEGVTPPAENIIIQVNLEE